MKISNVMVSVDLGAAAADRGTSPEDIVSILGTVPDPAQIADENKRQSKEKALAYMGLTPLGAPISASSMERAA